MPAERAPMRKVREVLRLRHALGVSERQIAITTGVRAGRRSASIFVAPPSSASPGRCRRDWTMPNWSGGCSRRRRSTRSRHGRCPIGPTSTRS